jgi:hypothetical protein
MLNFLPHFGRQGGLLDHTSALPERYVNHVIAGRFSCAFVIGEHSPDHLLLIAATRTISSHVAGRGELKIMKTSIRAGSAAGTVLAAAVLAAGCGTSAASPMATKTIVRTVPAETSTKPPASATSAAPTAPAAPAAAAAPAQPAPAPAAPQFVNANAVVSQFYQDITDHNYSAAWALGGDNLSNGATYATWVAGYSGTTASIALGTVSDFGADQVQAELVATQLDGSVKTYQGTYTVQNGVIVAANIIQTS